MLRPQVRMVEVNSKWTLTFDAVHAGLVLAELKVSNHGQFTHILLHGQGRWAGGFASVSTVGCTGRHGQPAVHTHR